MEPWGAPHVTLADKWTAKETKSLRQTDEAGSNVVPQVNTLLSSAYRDVLIVSKVIFKFKSNRIKSFVNQLVCASYSIVFKV